MNKIKSISNPEYNDNVYSDIFTPSNSKACHVSIDILERPVSADEMQIECVVSSPQDEYSALSAITYAINEIIAEYDLDKQHILKEMFDYLQSVDRDSSSYNFHCDEIFGKNQD